MTKKGLSILERLDLYTVKKEGCWDWTGARSGPTKRPILKVAGKTEYAARLSYQERVGPIPNGLHILHKCDNESCTNPECLYPGTSLDNVRDREERGRHHTEGYLKGERHPAAVLSDADIARIRQLYQDGWKQKEIQELYDLGSTATVSNIVRGKRRC